VALMDGVGERTSSWGAAWSRRDFLARAGTTLAAGGFVFTAAELLAACGNAKTAGTTQSATPVRGGYVIEGSTPDVDGFNPIINVAGFDSLMGRYLFDGLITYTADGTLVPALAESLPKISSDGLTYTFNLRSGVRWTDGQPLTSDDVVFTYNLMFDPAYRAVKSPYRGDFEKFVAAISNPDPRTVIFRMNTEWSPFLALHGWHGVLPRHVLGSLTPDAINSAPFNQKPTVSSGVFKFVDWQQGYHVTLARNDLYWGGPSYLDQYVYKVIPQEPSLLEQLKSGQIDIARIISPGNVADVQAQPQLDVLIYPATSVLAYVHNLSPSNAATRFLGSKAVRQALLSAVDRQGIVDGIYFKVGGSLTNSFIPTASWAYNPGVTPKYTYDKARAESMLDAEGWKKSSSGIREKDGAPMKLEVLTSLNSKEYIAVAQTLQQAWKDIGLDVSVKTVPYVQELNLAYYQHAFDVAVLAVATLVDPDESAYWHSRNAVPGGMNCGSYKNPQVDQILDQAASTSDQGKRKQLYARLQDILADELPAGPLLVQQGFFAYNKRVHGMGRGQIGTFTNTGPRPFMNKVFVTKS
jgi:peptide/nickel transport system substrate-binding protein